MQDVNATRKINKTNEPGDVGLRWIKHNRRMASKDKTL